MKRCRQFRGAQARGLLGVEATWDNSGYSAGGQVSMGLGLTPKPWDLAVSSDPWAGTVRCKQ